MRDRMQSITVYFLSEPRARIRDIDQAWREDRSRTGDKDRGHAAAGSWHLEDQKTDTAQSAARNTP